MSLVGFVLTVVVLLHVRSAFSLPKGTKPDSKFDIQGHRGGRGDTVESTLPAFAWGLIHGVKTLELDNGLTKDGVVVAWHDENLDPTKCQDTSPAFKGDPAFPYVGKFIADLTFSQLKTVDCGSLRLDGFPLQLTYPHIRISSLKEVFDFVGCVDPQHEVLFNIESKINPINTTQTRSVQDFVNLQHKVFAASGYRKSITYQSFDWRTLLGMKTLDASIPTAALVDASTVAVVGNQTSPWLAGIDLHSFPGPTLDEQISQAAKSIGAAILSPAATSDESLSVDPNIPGYVSFTTRKMIDSAHTLDLLVKPWTVNRLNIVEQLLDWGVDGIITDYPDVLRRHFVHKGVGVAPLYPESKVLKCLKQHGNSV